MLIVVLQVYTNVSPASCGLKTEPVSSSETMVTTYKVTRRHNLKTTVDEYNAILKYVRICGDKRILILIHNS
jgi:hypothetical protein